MAESEDVDVLKRRGRRRLIGAIALVLAAVIALPMVFDSEPRQSPPAVSVRIPAEDDSGFRPKVTPKTPAAPVESAKPEATPAPKASDKAAAKVAQKPAAKARQKPAAASDAERARAEAALADAQFIVPAGAYHDPSAVIEKLKAAKLPYYTEPGPTTASGPVTRVRAGPFASREAAEKALEQLKELGLKPGSIGTRS
jgi:DedD protein